MLQNIKSSYFIKMIYTFVEEAQKLKFIKYNKSMQKNLDISIINYKFFSGRYIIYESNGIGKEYTGINNKLIYEGGYFDGERNGKGKEYDDYDSILKFEGEYLNGKRNGKGKEYWNDQLRFEGEYLNEKRNGKGKEYYGEGKLNFESEYLNGKKWERKRIWLER